MFLGLEAGENELKVCRGGEYSDEPVLRLVCDIDTFLASEKALSLIGSSTENTL